MIPDESVSPPASSPVQVVAEQLPRPVEPEQLPPLVVAALARSLYDAVLGGRNARTARAYRADFEDFGRFLGLDPTRALDQLVTSSHGLANAMALAYRTHLVERGLAAATVARRLAALRSAVKLAAQLGRVAWRLEIESPRSTPYRDTRGPGVEGWRALRSAAEKSAGESDRGIRDLGIIRLLRDMGLRRGEVVSLDLADVDFSRSAVAVMGKGRTEKEWLTMPAPTRAAVGDWVRVRGDDPGPLFRRLDRGARAGADGGRLTGRSVHRLVVALGVGAQLSRRVAPHGLRHHAITEGLTKTGGDVAAVRAFSRHKNINTLMVYDDRRRDRGGDVAGLVAED